MVLPFSYNYISLSPSLFPEMGTFIINKFLILFLYFSRKKHLTNNVWSAILYKEFSTQLVRVLTKQKGAEQNWH